MAKELSKAYDPKTFEDKWYEYWLKNNLFAPKKGKIGKTYTIVIPPPNVTSVLHMGHGLNNTVQDILIRYKRMQGYETLWVPGTDHAGIATQNIVEKEFAKEGKKREDFTRDAFVERVWETALKHQRSIIEQLKKIGCSCDWNYNAFTLDEKRSISVKKVFVELYKKGLIYKSKYIVNWCPRCQTALADDEVNHKDKNGKIYYIKYPIKGSKESITVATTRPETMLGDIAIAFNPNDKRYLHLKGETIILPIVNRELRVIYDNYVDPKFGTGSVKVTPAHDPNDFQMGMRHNLDFINIFTNDARLNENVPERYQNLDRYECRKLILEDLEKGGYLIKVENHKNAVGECYRCQTVIEPRYSDQWFVKMEPLSKKAIEVVKNGKIDFLPKRWVKVYFNWLNNIKDWCISRQLWWGHRIPVYYCDCGEVIVTEETPTICPKCNGNNITQDSDVLDTWFSSWLWPFSTLGWPNDSNDLKKFYPTSTLVTGPDIIFFWVARMIMAGLEFMGDVPFTSVFFTGMVMDIQGRKMSKSLGNGIDPFEVIARHGADSLRYTMVAIVSPNQNLKLGFPKERGGGAIDSFDIGSRFANKIWNAARFLLMNIPDNFISSKLEDCQSDIFDRWIVSELYQTIRDVNKNLENAKFNDVAHLLQSFFWNKFCDWYIELVKSKINSNDTKIKFDSLSILIYILKEFLKLLHPIMPFITEEIYQNLPEVNDSIMVASYPEPNNKKIDKKSEVTAKKFFDLIYLMRNIRGEKNIPPEKKVEVYVKSNDKDILFFCDKYQNEILTLAKASKIFFGENITKPLDAAIGTNGDCEVFIDLYGLIDKSKEIEKLTKEYQKIKVDFDRTNSKLNSQNFISKAPKEVIEKERQKLEEFSSKMDKIQKNIESLK